MFYDAKTNLELSRCKEDYNLFKKLGYESNTEELGPACNQTDSYAGSCWVEPLSFDGGKYQVRICYHKSLGYVKCKDLTAGEQSEGFSVVPQDFNETNIGYQGGYSEDDDKDCPDVSSNINALGYNYIYEATDPTYNNSDLDKNFINTYCQQVAESFNPNNCEVPSMCPCNEDCKRNKFIPPKNSKTWINASHLMKGCYVCLQKFRAAHFYCRKVYRCLNKYRYASEVYNLAVDPNRRQFLKSIYGRGYYLCGYYNGTLCGCAKAKLAAGPRHFQRIVNKVDEVNCQNNDNLKNNPQCNLFETGVKVRQFRNEIISNPNASCKDDRLKKAEFGYKMRGTFFSPKLFVVSGTNERLLSFNSNIFDEVNADFFYNQPICENNECKGNNTYGLPTSKKLVFGNFYPVIFEIGNTYRSFDENQNCINKPSGDINYIMLRLEYNIATSDSSLVAYRVRFVNSVPSTLINDKKVLADGTITQFVSRNETLKEAIKNATNEIVEIANTTKFTYSPDPDPNFIHQDIKVKGVYLMFENIGKVKRPPLKYSYDEGSTFINSPLKLEIDRDAIALSGDVKATPLKLSLSPGMLVSFPTDEFKDDMRLPSITKNIRIAGFNKDVYDLEHGITSSASAPTFDSAILYLRRFSVGYSNPCVYLKDLSEDYLYKNIPSSINDCRNTNLTNSQLLECYTSFALYQECQGYMGCLKDKTSISGCQMEDRTPRIKLSGNDSSVDEYKKNTEFRSKSFICINDGFQFADKTSKLSNTQLYGDFGDAKYDYSIRWKKNVNGSFALTPGKALTIYKENIVPQPENEEYRAKHIINLNDSYFSGYQTDRTKNMLGALKMSVMLNSSGRPSTITGYDYYASDCDANEKLCEDKFEVKHRLIHETNSNLCVEASTFNGGQWNLLPRDLGIDYNVYVPLRCQFVRFNGYGAGGAGFTTDGKGQKGGKTDEADGANCLANWNITVWSTSYGIYSILFPMPCTFFSNSLWNVPKYDSTGSIGLSASAIIDIMKLPIFDGYLNATIGARTKHIQYKTWSKDKDPRCFMGPIDGNYVLNNRGAWDSRGGTHQFWRSGNKNYKDMRKGNTEIGFDNHKAEPNTIDYAKEYRDQKQKTLNNISTYEEEMNKTILKIYNARMADYYFSHLNNLAQQLYIADNTLYLIQDKVADKLKEKYQQLADEEKEKADKIKEKIDKMDELIKLLEKKDEIERKKQEAIEKQQKCKETCEKDCDKNCPLDNVAEMSDNDKQIIKDRILELNYNEDVDVNAVKNDRSVEQEKYNEAIAKYNKYLKIIEDENYPENEIQATEISYNELGGNFIEKLNSFKQKEKVAWNKLLNTNSNYNFENYHEQSEQDFLNENMYYVLVQNEDDNQKPGVNAREIVQDTDISLCLDSTDTQNSAIYKKKLKELYNKTRTEINKTITKKKEIINNMKTWVQKENYIIKDLEDILTSIESDYEIYNLELNKLNIDTKISALNLFIAQKNYKNLFVGNGPTNDSDVFYNLYKQCKSHRKDIVDTLSSNEDNYYKKFRLEHTNNYNPLTTSFVGIIDIDIPLYESEFQKDSDEKCKTNILASAIKDVYGASNGTIDRFCVRITGDNAGENCTEGTADCHCGNVVNIDRKKPTYDLNHEEVDLKLEESFNNIIDSIKRACEFSALEANEAQFDRSGVTSYVPIVTVARGMSPIDCRVKEMGCISKGGICPCFDNDNVIEGIYHGTPCVNRSIEFSEWFYQCSQDRFNEWIAGIRNKVFSRVYNTRSREISNFVNNKYLYSYSSNTNDPVGCRLVDHLVKKCNINTAYTTNVDINNIPGWTKDGYLSSNNAYNFEGHWNLYEDKESAAGGFKHRKGAGGGGPGTMVLSLDTPIEQEYINGAYYPILNANGTKIPKEKGVKDTRCIVKCPIVFVVVKQFPLYFEEIKDAANVDMLCEYSGEPEDDMEPRANTYHQPKKCYIITDTVKGIGSVKGRIVSSLDGVCPIAKCPYGTWNDTSEKISTGTEVASATQIIFDRKMGLCKPNNKYGNETKTSWYFNMAFDKNVYTALSFKGSRKAPLESSILQTTIEKDKKTGENIKKNVLKNYKIAECTTTASKAFQSDTYDQLINSSELTLYCNSNGFWQKASPEVKSSVGNVGNFPSNLYQNEDGNDAKRSNEYNQNNEKINIVEYLVRDSRYAMNKKGNGIEFALPGNEEKEKAKTDKDICDQIIEYQNSILKYYYCLSKNKKSQNIDYCLNNSEIDKEMKENNSYNCSELCNENDDKNNDNNCKSAKNSCKNAVQNKAMEICRVYKGNSNECYSLKDYSTYTNFTCENEFAIRYQQELDKVTSGNKTIDNYLNSLENGEFGRVLFKDLIKCPIIDSDKYDYDEDYSGNAIWDFADEGTEVIAKSCNSVSIQSGVKLPSRRCNLNGRWGPVVNKCLKGCPSEIKNGILWEVLADDIKKLNGKTTLTIYGVCSNKYLNSQNYRTSSGKINRTCNLLTGKWGDIDGNSVCSDTIITIEDNYKNTYVATPFARVVNYDYGNTYKQIVDGLEYGEYELDKKTKYFSPLYLTFLTNQFGSEDFIKYKFYQTNMDNADVYVDVSYKEIEINESAKSQYAYDPEGIFILEGQENMNANYIILNIKNGIVPAPYDYMLAQGNDERNEFLNVENWFSTIFDDNMNFTAQWSWKANLNRQRSKGVFNQTRHETQELFKNAELVVFIKNYKDNKEENLKNIALFSPYLAKQYAENNELEYKFKDNQSIRFRYPIGVSLIDYPIIVYNGVNGGYRLYRFEWEKQNNCDWGENKSQTIHKIGRSCHGKYYGTIEHNTTKHIMYTQNPAYDIQTFASIYCYDGRVFGYHAFQTKIIQDAGLTDNNTKAILLATTKNGDTEPSDIYYQKMQEYKKIEDETGDIFFTDRNTKKCGEKDFGCGAPRNAYIAGMMSKYFSKHILPETETQELFMDNFDIEKDTHYTIAEDKNVKKVLENYAKGSEGYYYRIVERPTDWVIGNNDKNSRIENIYDIIDDK